MNEPYDLADQLELFFGEASDAVAHVYARLRDCDPSNPLQLTGTLIGPSCPYAHTLKATYTFTDRGPGKSVLAETILPEPCFWTPEMPHLYRAEVHLRRDGEILASTSRLLGIRLLGKEGRKLICDGNRWVLRAVSRDTAPRDELSSWRESDAAMLVTNPDDRLCEQASQEGVLLVVQLDRASPNGVSHRTIGQSEGAPDAQLANSIRRLSRWPAVGMVVLPAKTVVDLHGLAHNLLLAERFPCDQLIVPSPWADVAVCDVVDPQSFVIRIADCKLPIIAARPASGIASVAEARTLCDRLQRDLVDRGEIGGYIV